MRVRTWVLSTKTSKNNQLEETGGSSSSHPKDLKLQNRQLITVGFVPAGASLPKPPGSTSLALIGAISGTTPVTSTTIASTPSTTTPTTGASTSTTTTKPASTSSTSTSTTTTKPASTSSTSTSTTKPST